MWRRTSRAICAIASRRNSNTSTRLPGACEFHPLGGVRARRAQRGGEDLVTGEGLRRCHAAEAVTERALALGEIGGPHLQHRVGEAELEDRAGDRRERGDAPGLLALPQLLRAAALERPQVLGRGGREVHAAVEPEYPQPPRVALPRR